MIEAEGVGHIETRDAQAKIVPEPLLLPESQAAHGGVQSVRADDEVEPARCTVRERDVDTVRILRHAGDVVAEDILGGARTPVVQDPGQVAALDLDVAAEQYRRERGQPAAARVDHRLVAHAGLAAADVVKHAHPLQQGKLVAAEVHRGGPAGAQPGRPLYHGDRVPGCAQPVRERWAGDAAAGDEYRPGHGSSRCPFGSEYGHPTSVLSNWSIRMDNPFG